MAWLLGCIISLLLTWPVRCDCCITMQGLGYPCTAACGLALCQYKHYRSWSAMIAHRYSWIRSVSLEGKALAYLAVWIRALLASQPVQPLVTM